MLHHESTVEIPSLNDWRCEDDPLTQQQREYGEHLLQASPRYIDKTLYICTVCGIMPQGDKILPYLIVQQGTPSASGVYEAASGSVLFPTECFVRTILDADGCRGPENVTDGPMAVVLKYFCKEYSLEGHGMNVFVRPEQSLLVTTDVHEMYAWMENFRFPKDTQRAYQSSLLRVV